MTPEELLEQMTEALRTLIKYELPMAYTSSMTARRWTAVEQQIAAYDAYKAQHTNRVVAEMNEKNLGGKQWTAEPRIVGSDRHTEDCPMRAAGRDWKRGCFGCTCPKVQENA